MGHFFYFIGKMVVNCVQKDTKKLLTFRMMICIMSKVRTRTKIEKGEKMCEFDEKLENAHMGRLIHMLSHQMKRNSNGMESVIENDELTVMQKHVLKFVLLESLHRDLYQKDIEEEFQIRKSTVTGILKLMEKHGYIPRKCRKRCPSEKNSANSKSGRTETDSSEAYCVYGELSYKRNFGGRCYNL